MCITKLIVLALLSCGLVITMNAQKPQLTAEERTAAIAIAQRFETQLDKYGDVTRVSPDLFVPDQTARYVREMRARRDRETFRSTPMLYTSGIEFDPILLDVATEKDWLDLYIGTFNFLEYSSAVFLNRTAAKLNAGGGLEDDEVNDAFEDMYPPDVGKMLGDHVILRNFVVSKDRRPIRNLGELRSVAATLLSANKLLHNKRAATSAKLTPAARNLLTSFRGKTGDEFGPWLTVADRETYGFPAGTRLITIFSSPMHELVLVKTGDDYKIVSARISSPD